MFADLLLLPAVTLFAYPVCVFSRAFSPFPLYSLSRAQPASQSAANPGRIIAITRT